MSFLTITEQVSACIRQDLLNGRWVETLPGRDQLSWELEVKHKTVDAALVLLENEGVLINQGAGRKRRIRMPDDGYQKPALRVAFLHDAELIVIHDLWTHEGEQRFVKRQIDYLSLAVVPVARHQSGQGEVQ